MTTRRWVRFVLLLVWLISGCGTVKGLVIGNLDWFIMEELEDTFDLTDRQYVHHRRKLRGHLAHFQENEVGPLIEALEDAANSDERLSDSKVRFLVVDYPRRLWVSVIARIAPDAASLFRSLSEKQWAHFEEQLEERYDKWMALRDVSEDEFFAEHTEQLEGRADRLAKWTGTLTDRQKKQFFVINRVSRATYQKEADTLLRSQREFVAGVRARVKQGDLESFIVEWASVPKVTDQEAYRSVRGARDNRRFRTWSFMEKTMSGQQRAYRRRKLLGIANDLAKFRVTNYGN